MNTPPCPTPPKPTKNYVDPAELAKFVRVYRKPSGRTKAIRDRRRLAALAGLCCAWEKIARGINARLKFARNATDTDDYVQDCVAHLLEHGLANADPEGNLFAYFTRICQNVGRARANATAVEAVNFADYAAFKAQIDTIASREESENDVDDVDAATPSEAHIDREDEEE